MNKQSNDSGANERLLSALKGRGRGRRCFVIGNGPSLRVSDLELIAQHGEITIGSNKIFRLFEKTNWRPTIHLIEDQGVAESSGMELGRCCSGNLVYADYLEELIPETARYAAFRLRDRKRPPELPNFSVDFADGACAGGTVTYTALQLAHWLGCKEVYLLGVDFDYKLDGLRPSERYPGFNTYVPSALNYFVGDYIAANEPVVAPDMESSHCAYEAAQLHCESVADFKIFNATRGGKLDVFPRVEFDALFDSDRRGSGCDAAPGISMVPASALTATAMRETLVTQSVELRRSSEIIESLAARPMHNLRVYSFGEHFGDAAFVADGEFAKAEPSMCDVEGRVSRVIFLHPPGRLNYRIPTGAAGVLGFAVGLHPEVWNNPASGQCRFTVVVDGSEVVNVVAGPGVPGLRWHWCQVPIAASRSNRHWVEFSTCGVGSQDYRWALWRAPTFIWCEKDAESNAEFMPPHVRRAADENN